LAEDFVMDYRAPAFNAFGTIDCEIEHPIYGWIPFTCDPNDKGAELDAAAFYAEMRPHAAPYIPPPAPPAPTPEEVYARMRAARAAAYRDEADPLFFKWQAGEATEAEWLDKRAEIRARYPYAE
jgi:hypothetical protein